MICVLAVVAKNLKSVMENNELENQNPEEPTPEQLEANPEDPAIAAAGESADPTQAVDGMLDAAIQLGEAEISTNPLAQEETLGTASVCPSYSLCVKSLSSTNKELLLKSLEKDSHGCSFEAICEQMELNRLHLTKLTEMQMVAFAHLLHRNSIPYEIAKHWDEASLQAEIENFAQNNFAVNLNSEGAPSVNYLPGSNDVLLLSSAEAMGYTLLQSQGIVLAHKSLARKFFRNLEQEELLEKELRKIKKESPLRALLPQSGVEKCFRALFSDLRKEALALGANAVLDVKIECFPESSSNFDPELDQMRIVLSGTASVLDKTAL